LEKSLQRIGSLKNSDIILNVTIVLERLKKMESDTQNELKIMVNQAWAEEGNAIINCVKRGVHVKAIHGKNTIFPKEVIDPITKKIIKMDEKKIELKLIDIVPISIYITDKTSGVIFPNLNHEVDMNTILLSDDLEFRSWCEDVFDYYWAIGNRFNYEKTTII